MAARALPALFVLAAFGVSACGTFANPTERRTTATLRFNDTARSVDQAETEVREMCGDADVLSVSAPRTVTGPSGETLKEITATCRESFYGDRRPA